MKKYFKKIKKLIKPPMKIKADKTARFEIDKSVLLIEGEILIGKNSSLKIGKGVRFSGSLKIGENANVLIGENCDLQKVDFIVGNESEMKLNSHCIFDAPAHSPSRINVECGKLEFANNVRVQAEILIRFGGTLTIGTYSSINYDSEIRCEEKVSIGEYCLMSYGVCIYDTNTHSADWKERRERIPYQASEIKKPETKPVIIGNDIWIGKDATILKGAEIGDRSIVGIRTLVPAGKYPEDSIIVSPKPVVLNKQISQN